MDLRSRTHGIIAGRWEREKKTDKLDIEATLQAEALAGLSRDCDERSYVVGNKRMAEGNIGPLKCP